MRRLAGLGSSPSGTRAHRRPRPAAADPLRPAPPPRRAHPRPGHPAHQPPRPRQTHRDHARRPPPYVHDPPLLEPAGVSDAAAIRKMFGDYRSTLAEERRRLLDRYRFVDAARKVVGVGSVGTRCFIVLLAGRDTDDPLFLQIEEATRSVIEDHVLYHGPLHPTPVTASSGTAPPPGGERHLPRLDGEAQLRALSTGASCATCRRVPADVAVMCPDELARLRPAVWRRPVPRPRPPRRPHRHRRLPRQDGPLRPRRRRVRPALRATRRIATTPSLRRAVSEGVLTATPAPDQSVGHRMRRSKARAGLRSYCAVQPQHRRQLSPCSRRRRVRRCIHGLATLARRPRSGLPVPVLIVQHPGPAPPHRAG